MKLFARTTEGAAAIRNDMLVRTAWENGFRSKVTARSVNNQVYGEYLRSDSPVQYYARAQQLCAEAVRIPAMRELSKAAHAQLLEMEMSLAMLGKRRNEIQEFENLAVIESPVELLWNELIALEETCRQLAEQLQALLSHVKGVRDGVAKSLAQCTVGTDMLLYDELCGMHDEVSNRAGKMYLSNIDAVFSVIRGSVSHLLVQGVLRQQAVDEKALQAEWERFSCLRMKLPNMQIQTSEMKGKMIEAVGKEAVQTYEQEGDLNVEADMRRYYGLIQKNAADLASALAQTESLPAACHFAADGAFVEPHEHAYAVPWTPVHYEVRMAEHAAGVHVSSRDRMRTLSLEPTPGTHVKCVMTDDRIAHSQNTLLAPLADAEATPLRRADTSLRQRLSAIWERYPQLIGLAEKIQPLHVTETADDIRVFLPARFQACLPTLEQVELLSSADAKDVEFPVGTDLCLRLRLRAQAAAGAAIEKRSKSIEERLRGLLHRRGRLDTATFVKLLSHLGVECETDRGKGSHESYEINGHRANLSGERLSSSYKWSPDRLMHMLQELHVPFEFFYNVLRVHYNE